MHPKNLINVLNFRSPCLKDFPSFILNLVPCFTLALIYLNRNFAGLLLGTLPHLVVWQIPQGCDLVYLSDELCCVHGFESDYRMAERSKV